MNEQKHSIAVYVRPETRSTVIQLSEALRVPMGQLLYVGLLRLIKDIESRDPLDADTLLREFATELSEEHDYDTEKLKRLRLSNLPLTDDLRDLVKETVREALIEYRHQIPAPSKPYGFFSRLFRRKRS